jgi:hypothetical protein
MNRFYELPVSVQWVIAILLLILGFGLLLPIIAEPTLGLVLLPVFAPLFNLVSVPFFRLIGYYKYLNPYVISTIQNDEQYDLHNVFTFDYLVNFTWADRGKPAQRTLLLHYFKALITIIERIENKELSPDVNIIGHSYFFNDRTAEKFGFSIYKAGSFWIVNSCLQFIELSYLYSFSQGRWAFPKFWKVKRAEIIGRDLVKQKEKLEVLVSRLTT